MNEKEKMQIINLREEGHSYGEIADKLKISINTIKSFCRRNQLKKEELEEEEREIKEKFEDRKYYDCKYCGRKLEKHNKGKARKFCSEDCRRSWWKENKDKHKKKAFYTLSCKGCGIQFKSYGNKSRKYCTHDCYIKHRFKGGDTDDNGSI